MPCTEGPYIWDKSEHHSEGIGSTFQLRKYSFITAHLLNAKWIGMLTNSHNSHKKDLSSNFGLSYPECDEHTLWRIELLKSHNFIYVNKSILAASSWRQTVSNLTRFTDILNTTIIVYPNGVQTLDQQHNYEVFDERFRKRFYQQRVQRKNPLRNLGEYWITIHFRWGDTASNTDSPENVITDRGGLSFFHFCLCIEVILKIDPNIKIFVFAENYKHPETCSHLSLKNVIFSNESSSWEKDLDIMSQSQLLIGGLSSFFVLGAHLCESCDVIHCSTLKFAKSDHEKILPPHLREYYCNYDLKCYLQHIERILR